MAMRRDEKTGRFISDNSDVMTRAMTERRANTRGARILRQLAAIDAREHAAKKQREEH